MNFCGSMSREQCQPNNRGQFQPKTQPVRTTLGRCNNKSSNNVIIIDVDRTRIDIIIVDTPESSNRRSRHSSPSLKLNQMCSSSNVISIDDEENDDGFTDADQNATSSKTCHPSSEKYFPEDFPEESDSDECQVLAEKREIHSESPKWMFDNHSSEWSNSGSEMSESDMSESDIFETTGSDSDSDCEIMDDSSVKLREVWEKAALKRKMEKGPTPSKEDLGTFGSHNEPGIPFSETAQAKDEFMCTNADSCGMPNKDKVHSNANISINAEDLQHFSDVVDGSTKNSPLSFKRRYPAGDKGDIHGASSQNKSESLSENPHRPRSQSDISFAHNSTSKCGGQDISCDTWMQHGLNGLNGDVNSLHSKSVNEDIPDKHQDESVPRHGSSSPCNSHPPQDVRGSQSRKVTDAAEVIYSFYPQSKSDSSGLNIGLGENNTDVGVDHSFGKAAAACQGPSEDLMEEEMNSAATEQSSLENINMRSDIQNNIIGEWEKHKTSEECGLAEEEEESRRRQLQIQAEKIQKVRKRKRAENLRLLDMEKRQKQRVEEMRESQKREEETINLKSQLRSEIRKELEKLEMKYTDMASLLRGLGINVSGGPYPMPYEVNAAYRQALFKFHPDRASRTDIRQQVEAEEKFKLISRLKEKLLPTAY